MGKGYFNGRKPSISFPGANLAAGKQFSNAIRHGNGDICRYMDRKKLVSESIGYIIQHLEDELSLDTVAAHFFVSKFHFSRIFREETGETLYSFIKRCRMDQSAVDMKLNPTRAITDPAQ